MKKKKGKYFLGMLFKEFLITEDLVLSQSLNIAFMYSALVSLRTVLIQRRIKTKTYKNILSFSIQLLHLVLHPVSGNGYISHFPGKLQNNRTVGRNTFRRTKLVRASSNLTLNTSRDALLNMFQCLTTPKGFSP